MNQRIFVEKKSAFDIQNNQQLTELQEFTSISYLKTYLIYDFFSIEKDKLKTAYTAIIDSVTDIIHTQTPTIQPKHYSFAVEYIPGQFNQKAHAAQQAIQLVTNSDTHNVKTAKLYVCDAKNEEELIQIQNYIINKVDSQIKNLNAIEETTIAEPSQVPIINNFIDFSEEELQKMHQEWSFSFDFTDLQFIQKYFQEEERNPTETELKVLDTYWSDHCRHTTFFTELQNIEFKGTLENKLQTLFQHYLQLRKELNREHKPISLMDLGTIAAKYLHSKGKLNDLVISEEINACTIEIEVEVNGKNEPWYLLFKNETHNHPTEIEPFGGASTCIGGAIRDPLSGRAFVYQAMRVTGSANPLEKIQNTIEGKLPQKKITKTAAKGYSSYGNQIGLPTSNIAELYDEGYKAKRMEVGFVAGAVPKNWVKREIPSQGDKVIVLGGKTGRDGVGGATGSSKIQKEDAIQTLSAEVQKGDAVEERKIQRLFRNPKVTQLIKRCNDFGAGGVSVAIGEIADSLFINLDQLPTKYSGLNGTELAISESQERMAVVVKNKDVDEFISLAKAENIIAVEVAEVTDSGRLQMVWKGEKIVDLDRKFLETAGTLKTNSVTVNSTLNKIIESQKELTLSTYKTVLSGLNVCSQKGLIEQFDSHVGQTTVLMPLGGKRLLTPALASVHTLPIQDKNTDTVSMASWGFSTALANHNPFIMGSYAVIESVSKIVASGGNYANIRLSFQEYFEKLNQDSEKWGKPFQALLGALEAQLEFEIAAIGGKDSMSGTYKEINVPPTLISFACCVENIENIISPEFKKEGNFIYILAHETLENGLANFSQLKEKYSEVQQHIRDKKIVSAQIIKEGGLAAALFKMAVGNALSCDVSYEKELFSPQIGSLVLESKVEIEGFELLGVVTASKSLGINQQKFDLKELESAWQKTLEPIFPSNKEENTKYNFIKTQKSSAKKPKFSATISSNIPTTFIPIFPGTNCEYESQKVMQEAGSKVETALFCNQDSTQIQQSIDDFEKKIRTSEILFFPGGFSSGDEPDGSAKYIVSILKNAKIKEAIHLHLQKGGLILGICNGFQALIKSGLLPYGEIRALDENSPTLTFNSIGRHINQTAKIRVNESHSPWVKNMAGKEYIVPFSHGEGRFFANEEEVNRLIKNQQIVTQYIKQNGKIATNMPENPNGSIFGIEGITDLTGQIYGRMGHPERFRKGLIKNIPDVEYMDIFANGVKYFKRD